MDHQDLLSEALEALVWESVLGSRVEGEQVVADCARHLAPTAGKSGGGSESHPPTPPGLCPSPHRLYFPTLGPLVNLILFSIRPF